MASRVIRLHTLVRSHTLTYTHTHTYAEKGEGTARVCVVSAGASCSGAGGGGDGPPSPRGWTLVSILVAAWRAAGVRLCGRARQRCNPSARALFVSSSATAAAVHFPAVRVRACVRAHVGVPTAVLARSQNTRMLRSTHVRTLGSRARPRIYARLYRGTGYRIRSGANDVAATAAAAAYSTPRIVRTVWHDRDDASRQSKVTSPARPIIIV